MSLSSAILSISRHNLYFEQHGPPAGHVVVLLHHGLGSVKAWKSLVPALTQAGFRTLVYDRWGYGQSSSRTFLSVPGFEEDIMDLHCALEHYCIQRAALVGHSDGGTIGLLYAAQFPSQVACLATIAAHVYVELKMQIGIELLKEQFEHDQRFRQGLSRVHHDKYQQVFYNWYNGWHDPKNITWDMRPSLVNIGCSTLVIQGYEDEHATPRHAEQIAGHIQGAELWLVPGAGHMLIQDMPELFNTRLIGFLKTNLC